LSALNEGSKNGILSGLLKGYQTHSQLNYDNNFVEDMGFGIRRKHRKKQKGGYMYGLEGQRLANELRKNIQKLK